MKKICGLIVAALLFCFFTGQAMADNFAQGDLIRVLYNTNYSYGLPTGGTYEYATDLGSLTSLINTKNNTVGDNFTAYAGSGFGNIQAAYYVFGTDYTPYIAAPPSSGVPNATGSIGSLIGAFTNQQNLYQGSLMSGSTITARVLQSNGNNYTAQMNFGGPVWGTYGQYLDTVGAAEARLTPLATGGYVDMSLYSFDIFNGGLGMLVTNADGTTFDIRTLANGYTEINPATVPIPPSMLLLGTGLLGLIGFRRKG